MTDFKRFKYQMLIREHHLDTFNHVNNATYLQILEDARWEFLNVSGLGLKIIHESGVGPVVLECNIKFLKELRLRQMITIESQMLSYEKKIGVMSQTIFDENETVCCQAKLTFGVFDLNSRKLILPSLQWLQAIGIDSQDAL